MTFRTILRWSAGILAIIALIAGGWLMSGAHGLDRHMLSHVLIVDVAAAMTALALPARVREGLVTRIDAVADHRGVPGLVAIALKSPIFLLVVWTLCLTTLMLPIGYREAYSAGPALIEAVSLFVVGFALWRVTFDEHRQQPLSIAIWSGGLAWWGRHLLAMVGRLAILPAIFILWFAPAGTYQGADSNRQELAAGVILAAEMSIFAAAFILFFVLFLRSDAGRPSAQR